MAIKNALARRALSLLGSLALRLWRKTIDWKVVYFDPTADPVHPQGLKRGVFACWHEVMLMPIALRGCRNTLALTSEHGDGELIGRAMQHLGWNVMHGSSTRGGVSALLRLLRADDRHISFTPDGPRGPRRTMSIGPIFLASKLGLPLTCAGYAFDRPWRMRSWDRFAVPRPFSRARAVFGPSLLLSGKLNRDDMESHREWFEQLLNWLTEEAEAWAESGKRRPGEVPMLVGEAPTAMARWKPEQAVRLPDWLHKAWISLGNSPIQAVAPAQQRAA